MADSDIIQSPADFKKQAAERAYNYECEFHGCSQSVLRTFQELLDMKDDLLLKAAAPLCAGLGLGKSCGALAAGVMVIGMVHGRPTMEDGLGGLMKGFTLAQDLVRRFEAEYGTTVCYEISKVDWGDMQQVVQFFSTPDAEKACQVSAKTAEMVADVLIAAG